MGVYIGVSVISKTSSFWVSTHLVTLRNEHKGILGLTMGLEKEWKKELNVDTGSSWVR